MADNAIMTWCFNPRPRAGGDIGAFPHFFHNKVSIHAPAGGRQRGMPMADKYDLVSIHAPARGATRHGTGPETNVRVSIHAPAGGDDIP